MPASLKAIVITGGYGRARIVPGPAAPDILKTNQRATFHDQAQFRRKGAP